MSEKNNTSHGFFLEVDIDCPDELHDEQNDFPIPPDKLKVTKETLSPEQIDDIKKFNIKIGTIKKLIPNLSQKKNYTTHYRNLKYYLANG